MNSAIRAGFLFRRLHRCVYRQIECRALALPLLNCHSLLIKRNCHTSVGNVEIADIPDIKDLTKGDHTLEKKLKVIILEVDIWRQEGERIPTQLKPADWKELISLQSRSARKKYLLFCWKKQMSKANEKKKKELKRIDREKLDIPSRDRDDYGLGGNTIFMRVRESTMTNYLNGKLIEAMQFGEELVVDCGYDKYMTMREAKNCAKQLMLLFSENRLHINPFNLYFCNVRKENKSIQEFGKLLCTPFEPHFPLNITEKSYLDLFPKQNLVYLTPHCREELLHYDHNAVYIIGAMVDKVNNEPLSLAKAKEEGLKMAKLPLDRYLSWGSGSGKARNLMKMACDLIALVLTGDESMNILYSEGRGEVFHAMVSWLGSDDEDLQITGVLAMGNFARTDKHCIQMVEAGVSKKLLALVEKNNSPDGDIRLQHALLSAIRNLVIPGQNKAIVLNDGLVKAVTPMLAIPTFPVVFKLLGTLRMVVDGQEDAACELGKQRDLIDRLVKWCDTDDHPGVQGEANRLLAWLIKNSRNAEVLSVMIEAKALPCLVKMVSVEHAVMQIEALIALVLTVVMRPDSVNSLLEANIGESLYKLLKEHGASLSKEVLLNLLCLIEELVKIDNMKKHLVEKEVVSVLKPLLSRQNLVETSDKINRLIATLDAG